jgi:ribosomal protein L22
MAGDAGTKTDQPSDREGMAGGPGKNSMEAGQAGQLPVGPEAGGDQASANPGRSGAAAAEAPNAAEDAPDATGEVVVDEEESAEPMAAGTTAAVTGIDKAGAEEALREVDPGSAPGPTPKVKKGRVKPAAPNAVIVRASARYVRTAPRKARLVADHVRGKSVDEARAILAYSPRAAAEDWRKLLESCVANAENNHDLVGDDLRVLTATADEGPTLKRFRPRAMGRATRIRKRTSHLTITLTPKEA